MKYAHIVTAFNEASWAIMPSKLDEMAAFLKFASDGGKFTAAEAAERIGSRMNRSSGGNQANNISVIPIVGIISQKIQMMTEISGGPGGSSTDKITSQLRAAIADDSVKSILLDIDSPGGAVYGCEELASEIYRSRSKKPIVASVNSLCASAAYWLASQATEIVMTPSGECGSIGVYSQHIDISKSLAADGVAVTLVSAGEFKVEGNSFEPLSKEAKDFIQSRVDDYYAAFTQAVAKGRGVPVGKVRSDYGKGRVFGATDALKAGMVDRIGTFDQTVQRLAGTTTGLTARLAARRRERIMLELETTPSDADARKAQRQREREWLESL